MRARGFTLLEVMVALTIFAIMAVAVLSRLGDSIRAEQRLGDNTAASFIAQDVLTEMRLKESWSDVRNTTLEREYLGQKWQVRVEVIQLEEDLREVIVDVGPVSAGRDVYLQSLTTWLGQH